MTGSFSDATVWQAGKGGWPTRVDDGRCFQNLWYGVRAISRGPCLRNRFQTQGGLRVTLEISVFGPGSVALSNPTVWLLIPLLGNPRNFRENPPLLCANFLLQGFTRALLGCFGLAH